MYSLQPRKVSGYQVFAGERLREAGGHSLNVPLIKEIPSLWKALSDEEREVCNYYFHILYYPDVVEMISYGMVDACTTLVSYLNVIIKEKHKFN